MIVPYSDPDSRQNMAAVDQLPASFRPLVYEFGLVIVARFYNDGYDDPDATRKALEAWRARRQQQWLSTDYITAASVRSLSDALIRIRTSRGFRCH
jgi:hypothetical protein